MVANATRLHMSHVQTAQEVFDFDTNLLKSPNPSYPVLNFGQFVKQELRYRPKCDFTWL